MREIQRDIFVDNWIYENEYDLTYDKMKDTEVCSQFYNKKRNKGDMGRLLIYEKALKLGRSKRSDGRYKNYEYLITRF